MNQNAILTIRLTRGRQQLRVGDSAVNEHRGGPETLLRWLETQLGLIAPPTHKASRITEYAGALDAVSKSTISDSMATDRWATASALLGRRDELLLAGWDERDDERLPPLVRDLACAAAGHTFTFPGEATRVKRVLAALDSCQTLPTHECCLLDPPETWPTVWQEILTRLNVVNPPESELLAQKGTSLRAAQALVRGAPPTTVAQDTSFRYIVTRSDTSACEFVAAVLAASVEKLPDTVLYCEDDGVALRLDACLRRMGVPTTGASAVSRAHPALQILPLSLALCWEPVDPQALLDFLSLPVKPIARRVATKLANSLAEEPGLGSGKWTEAMEELCSQASDPDGKLRARLDAWLLCERTARGSAIASRLVRERCSLVAQWASGRAAILAEDPAATPELVDAMHVAAGQASLLGELVESQGATVSEPQLARLLGEAQANGVETTPCIASAGGPTRVRSLAEIDRPCRRLIWLGLGTADSIGCRWSSRQLQQLRKAGIDLDDGTRQLTALRSAEARGYSCVSESFLAVLLPQDREQRWHPIWLAIRGILEDNENPPALEDVIAEQHLEAIAPFTFSIENCSIEPPQGRRSLWKTPSQYLHDRETTSATELQDRLACPLKWVFNYRARLRSSPIAELPDSHRLKGTFCHSVLERVFGSDGPVPSPDAAATEVVRVFNERLPLDAAPLAQPDRLADRQKLCDELENATRVLVATLAAGGYRIVGIEVEVESEAFGKQLTGWIDCVAVRDDGQEAIVDFKYAGRNKYRALIEEGKAVQLATYAYGRTGDGNTFPAVAYLVLADALIYTPSGSPLEGDRNRTIIDGPAIQSVWQQFTNAVAGADGWLSSAEPVPARPLQDSNQWPSGSTLVLDAGLAADKEQEVCRYCDYKLLCGLKGTL